jgi:hypothetical protein
LGLLGVWDLRNGLALFVSLITGFTLIITALETLDEGSRLVILGVILSLALLSGRDNILVLLFSLDNGLGLFGLGGGLLSSGLIESRRSSLGLLLLGLLVGGLLPGLLVSLGGGSRRFDLLIGQEICGALTRLNLTGRLGLGLGRGSGLLSLGLCGILLRDRLGNSVLGGISGLSLDLLGFFGGRVGGDRCGCNSVSKAKTDPTR